MAAPVTIPLEMPRDDVLALCRFIKLTIDTKAGQSVLRAIAAADPEQMIAGLRLRAIVAALLPQVMRCDGRPARISLSAPELALLYSYFCVIADDDTGLLRQDDVAADWRLANDFLAHEWTLTARRLAQDAKRLS